MPSGSSSQAAEQIYNYLYSHYFQAMPLDRTVINWRNPILIATWLIILAGFLYLVTRHAVRVHRKRNELYGATSFAGNILERNGKVAIASYLIWLVITLWSLSYIISHALNGQIY